MPLYAITLGALLVLLGFGAYFMAGGPGEASITALIPAFLGIPIMLAGLIGQQKPAWRKGAVYTAAAFALIGLLGTAPGLIEAIGMVLGDTVERPMAVVVQAITAILCIGYLLRVGQSLFVAR